MERIISLMKEKGITKTALSERLNIKNQNFNAMLKNPTYETLSKIATALNVPMWQLFASPEEVQLPSNAHSIKCPHCGNEFPVSVNVEFKTQNKD